MKIGIAAEKSGVPPTTIRYYESIGLIRSTERARNGYRVYDGRDVRTLCFIRRARSLGFPIDDVARLLVLSRGRKRPSAAVRAIAVRHLQQIDRKLRELKRLKRAVGDLVNRCHGDHRPTCPIIDELEGREQRVGSGSGAWVAATHTRPGEIRRRGRGNRNRVDAARPRSPPSTATSEMPA